MITCAFVINLEVPLDAGASLLGGTSHCDSWTIELNPEMPAC